MPPSSDTAKLLQKIVKEFISACESSKHTDPSSTEYSVANNEFMHVYCVAASNLLLKSCLRDDRIVPGPELGLCLLFVLFAMSEAMGTAQSTVMNTASKSGELAIDRTLIDAAWKAYEEKKRTLDKTFKGVGKAKKNVERELGVLADTESSATVELKDKDEFLQLVARWSNVSRRDDLVAA
jgi:hypothetical protein